MDEKKIKQMQKDLCECYGGDCGYEQCGFCRGEKDEYVGCMGLAEKLYDAGYRKQSDTVREFVQKLDKDWVEVTIKEYGTFYAVSEERIQELAKEYGVEVEE